MLHANAATILLTKGGPVVVRKGQEFADNDPIVRQYGWLFGLDRKGRKVEATRDEYR